MSFYGEKSRSAPTELRDEHHRHLRLALGLMDILPGSETSKYFEQRVMEVTPAVHEFLAGARLIDPVQQHFVGFKGPRAVYRIPPEHTARRPCQKRDLFENANRLAREFFGLAPTPPPAEVVMPIEAVPTLISIMTFEADGLAGGGNGQHDETLRLRQLVYDFLTQRNLRLPEVNRDKPEEIRRSLDLQPLE